MCARAVIVPGNHGRIHLKRRQEDGMAKTKVIGGKTVTRDAMGDVPLRVASGRPQLVDAERERRGEALQG
jgi:hypothetical protein